MRICFILPSAYGYFDNEVAAVGGGARQLSFVSRELVKRFDVHFVVGDYGQPRQETVEGVTLHRAYDQDPDANLSAELLKSLQLGQAMYRADADAYLYRGHPKRATVAYLFARLMGRHWVYNLADDHNPTVHVRDLNPVFRRVFIHSLFDADAVIAQSTTQAETLQTLYGLEPIIVPSGYPEAENILAHEEREYFLWVGRLEEEQKRPHLFLNLAEQITDQQFSLAGPGGPDEDYNEHIMERAEALENVTYVGWVNPDEIHAYYRRAIALVNTSAYEGFPSTFLEAWRYRTPVLSLAIDPGRYVKPTVEGYAEEQFETLVADTQRLAADVLARQQYADPAYKYFLKNLTIEEVATQYGDLFSSL